MKKTIALLLGLMLVLGFALVACGDEATTDEPTEATEVTEATETTAAMATETTVEEVEAVDWTEVEDYEGSEVTLTGVLAAVDNIFVQKGVTKILVRVGGLQPEPHMNIVVELDADGNILLEGLTEEMLNDLVGKTIEITGVPVVNAFDVGAYDVFLTDLDQLVEK